MQAKIESEVLECQASAFLLVSTVLRTLPEKKWLDVLVNERVFEAIPYALEQVSIVQAQEALQTWSRSYDETCFDVVYSDYMNLFIGPGKPSAPPWETAYLIEGECLVFQKETLEVRKWFRSFDLQIDKLYNEPDDHIAYELEFIATLSQKAAEALAQGNAAEAERLCQAQSEFLQQHLLTWAFDWCSLVIKNATTDFYRGIAFLVQGFLIEITANLSIAVMQEEDSPL